MNRNRNKQPDLTKVKLGMTREQLIAALGKPSDEAGLFGNDRYPGVLVYGGTGGSNRRHYEFHFGSNTRKDSKLWLVMKMPEHETILTTVPKEVQERQRKLREKWEKENRDFELKEDVLERLKKGRIWGAVKHVCTVRQCDQETGTKFVDATILELTGQPSPLQWRYIEQDESWEWKREDEKRLREILRKA